MRTFPVADDVVAQVWAMARPEPFEQLSFSEALRKVLAQVAVTPARPFPKLSEKSTLKSNPVISADELLAEIHALPASRQSSRPRAPKADLKELVRIGLLREGQELTFVDYRGNRQTRKKAAVRDGELVDRDGVHSMSSRASELLKQEGYIAESVRGPDHWADADGRTVRELWAKALQQRMK